MRLQSKFGGSGGLKHASCWDLGAHFFMRGWNLSLSFPVFPVENRFLKNSLYVILNHDSPKIKPSFFLVTPSWKTREPPICLPRSLGWRRTSLREVEGQGRFFTGWGVQKPDSLPPRQLSIALLTSATTPRHQVSAQADSTTRSGLHLFGKGFPSKVSFIGAPGWFQSVRPPTLDVGSGHDPSAMMGMEPAWGDSLSLFLSLALSLCPSPSSVLSLK